MVQPAANAKEPKGGEGKAAEPNPLDNPENKEKFELAKEFAFHLAKGIKIYVWKFKRRKGYRRKTGHRQKYTEVRITDVKVG